MIDEAGCFRLVGIASTTWLRTLVQNYTRKLIPRAARAHRAYYTSTILYYIHVASFSVLPRTRFRFTCGGEHFETGKAWSETSREVDVVLYIYSTGATPTWRLPTCTIIYSTTSTSRDVSDPGPFQNVHRRNYREPRTG